MKISRIVIALSGAFSGTFAFECQAQSAVTFYGTIDAGIRSLTNVNAAGNRLVKLSSNGEFYNNRIGFKGDEDLGGGVRAHLSMDLREKGPVETEMCVTLEAHLLGKIGEFGQPVIRKKAEAMLQEFAAQVSQQLLSA